MNLPTTEDRDPISIGLSKKSDEDVLSLLLQRFCFVQFLQLRVSMLPHT